MSFEWLVRSRRVVTPQGVIDGAVAITGEKIAGVPTAERIPAGARLVDVGTFVVAPGVVDTHVHVNEPGRTEWEGFSTATRAAAAGGITTIVDMPLNSHPVTTSAPALEEKIHAAGGKLWVDCAFWGGLIPENAASIGELLEAGVAGVKAFLVPSGIDDFPMSTERDLRQAMPLIARRRRPLLVHAELELPQPGPAVSQSANPRLYSTYLASRPPHMEVAAMGQMARLCAEFSCPVHVVHLSSADALPISNEARAAGLPFSLETCPHYLLLSAEEIDDGRTEFKCAPPIRERANQARLWQALRDGAIDAVVSDHSPCLPALKAFQTGDFVQAWGGISSLQWGLSLVWTQARQRGFGLEHVSRWMSAAPANLAGLDGRKGAIAPGYDADLVVWNPEANFTVSREMILHRHGVTPYLGHSLDGVVEMTILRGKTIYERGHLADVPSGQPLLRRDSGRADG